MTMHPKQVEYLPRGYGVGLQEVADFLWECAGDVRNDFSLEVFEDYAAAVGNLSALLAERRNALAIEAAGEPAD